MPDLKSELSKVLNEWNPSETTTMTTPSYHTITNNITRATFDCVAQTPGVTRRDLIAKLKDMGYKSSSSSSMVTQMLHNGNFRYQGDGLFTTQPEYSPRPRQVPVKPRVRKALRVPTQHVAEPVRIEPEWTVESVIGNLNVRQAMAVYMELRTIFGA